MKFKYKETENAKSYKEQINQLVALAKTKKKAIGIGASGRVGENFFPLIEYDGRSFQFVLEMGFLLYDEFDLDRFTIFRTKNGHHLRFYYDNYLTLEETRLIVDASQTNKEFRRVVNRTYPQNRVTGKHAGRDIVFLGEFGKLKQDPESYSVKAGKSLLRLHRLMGGIDIKKELVLPNV